ncbi:MAG: Rid family hydrolase [Acidobacteriota bacterium]
MATIAAGTPAQAVPFQRPKTDGERQEMTALGIMGNDGRAAPQPPTPVDLPATDAGSRPIARTAIEAPSVLNEAYHYAKPAAFTRGLRFDIGDKSMLMISGTASVDESGRTVHVGEFRAQLWRAYRNITELLASEGATWHDIVRTTCYLRDIERDYADFNQVRTSFFTWLGLDPLPASTAIQARICREDLLVEIEAIAIVPRDRRKPA